MKTYTVDGIILKRQNVGEADRILTVLTKNHGKIKIKAIGVRKIASKRASHVEPLNFSTLSLYKGHQLPILTEAVTLESYDEVKSDLKKIGYAYHLCELVDGLCPENVEQKEIFALFQTVLEKLSVTQDIATLTHEFEMSLLSELGYYSPAQHLPQASTSLFIEGILERRLKTRQILYKLI